MIKVCGYNNFNQLGEKSTGENSNGFLMIKTPQKLHIDPSTILSFHVFRDHGILITRNGSMQAIGFNKDGRISDLLPKEVLLNFTEFAIKDDNGVTRKPISAFCGISFTLYMVSKVDNEEENELFFSHTRINEGHPLFVNINGLNPKSLFGGFYSAAAIDDTGKIIFIYPAQLISFPTEPLESATLPSNEKAVKVSCCFGFVLALSSTGKVYESTVSMGKKLDFKLVSELQNIEITDIDGIGDHCIAVSKGGQVFCRGSNNFCQLGLDKEIDKVDKFTQIESMQKYKIVHAYAGFYHSLFQTNKGKLISCGSNVCGEILLGERSNESDGEKPKETLIKSGASFCIAGNGLTVVFIGCQPPPNIPNKLIGFSTEISEEEVKIVEDEISDQNSIEKVDTKNKKSATFLNVDDIEKLKKIEFISRGGQSKVFLVCSEDGTKYALKQYDCVIGTESENTERMRRFLQEFELLNEINHPNIIKTFGICLGDENNKPSILLEYCPLSLNKYVKKMNDIEKVVSSFEICNGMSEVHKRYLIHRDLKPDNILFDQNKHVKIIDFGIAKLNDEDDDQDSMTLGIGTLKFMAPEMLNEDDHYDNKIDVYAFGIILFFIMTNGNYPKIRIGDVSMGKKAPIPDYINEFTRNLILRCWSTEPKDRPSFIEIVDEIKRNNFNMIDGIESKIETIKKFLNIQD